MGRCGRLLYWALHLGTVLEKGYKGGRVGRYLVRTCCGWRTACDIYGYERFDAAKALAPEFGVAAMAVSLIAVPVVSLFTKKPDQAIIDKCFENNVI